MSKDADGGRLAETEAVGEMPVDAADGGQPAGAEVVGGMSPGAADGGQPAGAEVVGEMPPDAADGGEVGKGSARFGLGQGLREFFAGVLGHMIPLAYHLCTGVIMVTVFCLWYVVSDEFIPVVLKDDLLPEILLAAKGALCVAVVMFLAWFVMVTVHFLIGEFVELLETTQRKIRRSREWREREVEEEGK